MRESIQHNAIVAGKTQLDADSPQKVVIWRNYWLSQSETFIRDQVASMTRWKPILVGRREFSNPLVRPQFAPYPDSIHGRIAGRLPPIGVVRLKYHDIFSDPSVKIVHAHFGPDGLSVLSFASRFAKPLVVTFHGMDVTAMPSGRTPAAMHYRSRLRKLFDRANTLIAVSAFVADQLVKLGAPADKVRILYIGVGLDPTIATGSDRVGVIFVGRLVEKKGVHDLIEAMARLPAHLRSVPLTVVGYGPLLGSLRREAARQGLAVRFLGPQPSERVAELLSQHAVFCGPSKRAPDGDAEGLGMVFLEAARAGLPIVAYRHGGVPEAVAEGETGLLVPEGDVTALSSALARLLTDSESASVLGEAGRRRVHALFDVRRRTAELEQLYDSVADLSIPIGDR